jgi:hypothetical protein
LSPVLETSSIRNNLRNESLKVQIFGKSLSDYVKFERGFLILVLVVGLARLSLSLLGVPNAKIKLVSITLAFLLGLVYYSVKTYTSGFGSYKHLLPLSVLPVVLGNGIVIAGIVIAILTHKDNIFSAPEFSPGKVDGKNWGHVGGHVVAMIVLPLIFWVIGSWFMFLAKKMSAGRKLA